MTSRSELEEELSYIASEVHVCGDRIHVAKRRMRALEDREVEIRRELDRIRFAEENPELV